MLNELLPYYERELVFIRKTASEFASRYPERAGALQITRNGCDDPHVERMIEAFALIAGRIQRKMDEEFPEITQALIDLMYPHFLRPVPSMAIAQLEVDPEQSKISSGHFIPRGATLYAEQVAGVQCRFRTAYATRLWPIAVASATFSRAANIAGGISSPDTPYAIRIELQALGTAKFSTLDIKSLRFRIGGDPQAAHWIYELLFKNVGRIIVRYADKSGKKHTGSLPCRSITDVGFGRDEAILPYADTSFQGYRLLQEYFCFPQKFLFFDLENLDSFSREQVNDRLEIIILLTEFQRGDRATLLESAVAADTFQLGCAPVVNLFEHCAEPIRVSHAKTEYQVIPDVHTPTGMEVYSVNRVTSVVPNKEEPKEYRPFYSFRHAEQNGDDAFWYATRRPSERSGDLGTEVYLSLVDRQFKPSLPATEAITAYATCTNRDLPARLSLNGSWGELELEGGAIVRARALYGPTKVARPPLRRSLQWRLISHLALNHLSLVEGGADALREMLKLYDTGSSASSARQIMGIASIRSGRKMARVDSEHGFVFCQGVAIDAELDEEQFAGSGAFLLASILDRFFGLYSSVNSFTQLRVATLQRKGVVWEWPLRAGEQIVA
ncbi:MAG TPA: type VI secretion system baseplate subunit TssF [Candidatus Sulfotelmatobacter sp.]|nr:type VI secretion system baseplate subunit TssF [Candidatus Sulfotelmatobacter sp.]